MIIYDSPVGASGGSRYLIVALMVESPASNMFVILPNSQLDIHRKSQI